MTLGTALALLGALARGAGGWRCRAGGGAPRARAGRQRRRARRPRRCRGSASKAGFDGRGHANPPRRPRCAPRRCAPARLDALIDALVPLALESPVSGELVLSHLPPSRRAGTKPFLIEGLNAATGQWEPPVAGQRYGELQAGVQLASRSGALNEIEYSEFVQKVQAFADAVGAMPDFPDMLDVVGARASSTPSPARWTRC
jgi:hypothetical protein